MYNLFVLLILFASFTLVSILLQVQHFYILSPFAVQMDFMMSYLTKDGWWIRTTFTRFITSKVHLLNNFTYNHSVPIHTRACDTQQISFRCCHPPYYLHTHVFVHDRLCFMS
nr:MAG TPA: hypothetical protein [Caudoviricetes sp.]